MSEHIDGLILDKYAEEGLPAAQRETVEAHLADCTVCQTRLTSARQMSALLYRLPRQQPASDLAHRVNAVIAAQAARRPHAVARWAQLIVPAMFVAGLILLVLAVPQWSGWAQGVATADVPNEQAALAWLTNLLTDPGATLENIPALLEQTLISTVEEASLLLTIGTMLLASASVAGLAQLLIAQPSPAATARANTP